MWTYHPQAFLPHGSHTDPLPEAQPIYLTTTEDNRNGATVFCTTSGAVAQQRYARVLDVFDGHDAQAVAAARTRYSAYKAQGYALHYFKQTGGVWEEAS